MPQMKPLQWMCMLLMVSLFLTITMSILYYSTYPFISLIKKHQCFTQSKVLWYWKW